MGIYEDVCEKIAEPPVVGKDQYGTQIKFFMEEEDIKESVIFSETLKGRISPYFHKKIANDHRFTDIDNQYKSLFTAASGYKNVDEQKKYLDLIQNEHQKKIKELLKTIIISDFREVFLRLTEIELNEAVEKLYNNEEYSYYHPIETIFYLSLSRDNLEQWMNDLNKKIHRLNFIGTWFSISLVWADYDEDSHKRMVKEGWELKSEGRYTRKISFSFNDLWLTSRDQIKLKNYNKLSAEDKNLLEDNVLKSKKISETCKENSGFYQKKLLRETLDQFALPTPITLTYVELVNKIKQKINQPESFISLMCNKNQVGAYLPAQGRVVELVDEMGHDLDSFSISRAEDPSNPYYKNGYFSLARLMFEGDFGVRILLDGGEFKPLIGSAVEKRMRDNIPIQVTDKESRLGVFRKISLEKYLISTKKEKITKHDLVFVLDEVNHFLEQYEADASISFSSSDSPVHRLIAEIKNLERSSMLKGKIVEAVLKAVSQYFLSIGIRNNKLACSKKEIVNWLINISPTIFCASYVTVEGYLKGKNSINNGKPFFSFTKTKDSKFISELKKVEKLIRNR
jgi:hypothetical protein